MRRPPQQRTELHDRNESAEVLNFVFRVRAMDQSGQVEQFGSLVHFRPESVFQHFLRVLELLVIFEHVQVCQDAHDSRHTVNLMATEKKNPINQNALRPREKADTSADIDPPDKC